MEYRDIYRGYEIDYNPDHDGYWVMKNGVKLQECTSYDQAADEIDKIRQAENRKA